MFGDLADDGARAPARIHEILGDRLEPVDRRPLGQDLLEMDAAQPEAEAEARQVGDLRQVPAKLSCDSSLSCSHRRRSSRSAAGGHVAARVLSSLIQR